MSDRSLTAIDTELSRAVKLRDNARATIVQMSEAVIDGTRRIDELLAERSALGSVCPDTVAELIESA